MNEFVSTRGDDVVSFAEALRGGLAPDGGLYVPVWIEPLGRGRPPADQGFTASAAWTASAMLGDAFPPGRVADVVADALDFPVPLVEVEPGVHVLELFHGPSLAFKDVGARFMARAMASLAREDERPATVLVATSGDTGGAVAAAFHGVAPYRVVVLFPRGGVSERQRRQMTTLGGNVTAVAVDGTFDDCQRLAKEAFGDPRLRADCGLTSANSINVGRLIPQAFYYVYAAALLGWDRRPPTFVVPSGNLGNLCAGLLAHRTGMPAAGFVAALNRNRVFADYLEGGIVRTRVSMPTLSNAMDVGDPSNLERIRWLYRDDVAALGRDVRAVSTDDADTRTCIAEVYERTGYVLDPHTAVAWSAARRTPGGGGGPVVVLATAHPAKFPEVVEEATGVEPELPDALARRVAGVEQVVPLPAAGGALRELLLAEVAS
jgi:threonine synthase